MSQRASGQHILQSNHAESDEQLSVASRTDKLSVRINPSTRLVIDQIKTQFGYQTDADVLRHALGTQARIGQSIARGERIFVGDSDGKLLKELVFVGPA